MPITSWYDGVSIGNRPITAEWQETSGLARPCRSENSGYLWAQSDGTINKIFPISLSTGGDAGAWTLTGASPVDVEDLDSANIGGQPYIYLADTGNNANSANSRGASIDLRVYRIKEPVITGSTGNLAAGTDYETISCFFPVANTPSLRDCEVLMVDPDTGDMYFITKRFTPAAVYRLAHASSYSGTQTLEYLGTITTPPYSIGADNANGGYYVAGTISPDGTEILLKGYEDVYLFTRDKATQTIMQAMQGSATTVRAYMSGGYPAESPPMEPKGEGICYDYYGEDFYTASEYLAAAGHSASNHPTYRYVRATREATEATFRQGLNSYAGAQDTFIASAAGAEQTENNAADTTFVVDYDTANDQRYGLLKFDISDIPAGSVIVGADIEVYIAVEGAFFQIYEMYMDWTENSTFASLGRLPAFDGVDASATAIGGWTFGDWTNIDGADALNTTGSSGSNTVGNIRIKMPADIIQDWVDGVRENKGWVFYGTTNTNGLQFASSEAATASQRPTLYVRYIEPLPDADEVDEVEYKASTAYPAQSGERSAQRVPIDYISAGGISFADSRVMNMGRSGSVAKPIGAQVARGADTGVESISDDVAFPAQITIRPPRLVPKGVVDKVHKFGSDISPYLITSGWDWTTGQLNNILYSEMIGDNLITNGDFPSALTGWTATQTVSQTGGRASMPNDTYIYQSITVEANTNYRLSVDIIGYDVGLYVLDEDFMGIITSAHHGEGASLTHYIDFNSGDRTTLVIYIWSAFGGPNLVDNILVKQLQYGIRTTFGVEANGVNFLSGGKNIGNRNLS